MSKKDDNEFRNPRYWFMLAGASAVFCVFFAFECWCGDFMSGKFNNARENSRDIYEYGLYSWAGSSMKSEMEKNKEYALYALLAAGAFLGIGLHLKKQQ